MNVNLHTPDNPDRMLSDLAALGSAIQMAEGILDWARPRYEALWTQLESMTRPGCLAPVEARPKPAQTLGSPDAEQAARVRRYQLPSYELKGRVYRDWTAIGVYKKLMVHLLMDYPDRQEAIRHALARHGRKRPYLARERSALFPGKDAAWAGQHSVALPGGWYLDTNLSDDLKRKLLRAAAVAAGLTWNVDVVVRLKGGYVHAP